MTTIGKRSVSALALLALLTFVLIQRPSQGAISFIGGLTREVTVELGKTYEGTILLKNVGDESEEVKFYQTDYLSYADGTCIYAPPGENWRSNADWISFAPTRLNIPIGESATVHYTIKVPSDKPVHGTYWSMLMVEMIGKDSPEATDREKPEVNVGIRQIVRYGVQMVTHSANPGSRKVKFKSKLVRGSEKRILQVDVENVGERWLRPFLWTELYDQEGRHMGRFEADRLRIYPGTSARGRIDLSDLPEGTYKALVVVDGGGSDVYGATYTLNFESPGKPSSEQKDSTAAAASSSTDL